MSPERVERHVSEDNLAALALGFLSGDTRVAALEHLDRCTQCSSALEQFSTSADGLLHVAPEVDPPVGFEVRVLERMVHERPPVRTARHRQVLVAVAAAMLALGVGIGIGRYGANSPSPSPSQQAPINAHGSVLTADLLLHGQSKGMAVVFASTHPWILMTLHDVPNGSLVLCKVKTTSGRVLTVGSYWITSNSDSWQASLPVPAKDLQAIVITSPNGALVASSPRID